MGRVKSLSNSGSFVLRKDSQNAKDEYQVYIHGKSSVSCPLKPSDSAPLC